MTHISSSFWLKVEKRERNECWPFLGRRNTGMGYGRLDIFGEEGVYAHRVAYFLAHPGKIQLRRGDGPLVLHGCDNPICCNPRHLYLGTHDRNMRDKVVRGRLPDYSGDKGPRCKLTMEDAFWIRLCRKNGVTRRAMALLYDVSLQTIKAAITSRHYRDVP